MPSTLVHLKGQFTENTKQSECVCLSEFWGEFRGFGTEMQKNSTTIELCLVTNGVCVEGERLRFGSSYFS